MKLRAIALGLCFIVAQSATASLARVEYSSNDSGSSTASPGDDKNSKANSDPIYTKLRTIGLSGEYSPVENFTLKRDVATITFKEGQLYFLTAVEGVVTGAVFIGQGEFQMTPVLPIEQRHLSILTGTGSITERFTKMVVRFTDSTYEEIKKTNGIKSGPPNSSARAILDDNEKMLRKGRTYMRPNIGLVFLRYNLDERIMIDVTSANQRGLFSAFFDGKHYGDMMYANDPLGAPFVTPEEVVLVCFADDALGIWTSEHMRDHYRNPAVFDENHQLIHVDHQNIEAKARGKRLEAVVQTKFKSMSDGVRVVPFDLFARLRVKQVTDEKGRDLSFIQENRDEDADFAVILDEPLKKGQEYTLNFNYSGDDAVSDSGGGNYTLDARSNWYPNTYFGDRATYEITLKVPKGLTAVATGQPMGESEEGDYAVTRWKSEVPLAVAGFNYGKFKKSATQDEKLKYAVEAYANRDIPDYLRGLQQMIEQAESQGMQTDTTLGSISTVSLMDKAKAEAQVAIGLYSDLFGTLPYGRIAMTQQPYFNFGQAWPMLVYLPVMAYLDSTQRHQMGLDRASNFVKFVAAHEVAHQWWGHVIGWKSYRDQWMSERFAEFSASMFAQMIYKNDKFIEFWKEQRELITNKNQLGKRPSDVGGVYMGYRLDTPKTGSVTRAMIYPKGAFILHMLRMMMWEPKTGDSRFSAMMKDFVQTHYNQNVSTQDFWRIVEKHMTKEMDLDGNGRMNWFFNEWVYGTQIPNYKFDYRFENADGGKVKLVGKITQSNVEDSFKMRVPIYLDYDGKFRRLAAVSVYGNSTTDEFTVILDKKPKRAMLCGFEDVLCTMSDR